MTMQSDTEEPLVHSQFNLPTQQRRLRHLQSITVRNLVCPQTQGVDIINLQVFFTLHKDSKSKAFYTSEKITGSLNPTWQSFDLQRDDEEINMASQFLVVRVWVGVPNHFKVKIECHVHLTGLVFFSDRLQVSGLKHEPDTLLYGMYNHIFCYLDPATDHPNLQQLIPDMQVPQSDNHLPTVLMDRSLTRASYTESSLRRLKMVLKAVVQTHTSVRRIHSTIEDKLVSSSERSEKLSKREALLSRVRQLRQELLWQQHQHQKDGDVLMEHEAVTDSKGQLLKLKRTSAKEFVAATEEKRQVHIQSREMLVKENAQVMFRRRQLISEIIHHIYPIRKNEKEYFYICNVLLPNAEEYQGHDDNMVSVALGFVCHLTLMVAQFLDMPLRYPMIHKGSRSLIVDHVHSKLMDKDREFPLFGKGKEKFQYNYGVFLLNKNISQLRFYCGLGTSDLRQTLSNLKSLLEQRLGFKVLSPSQKGFFPGINTPITTSLENSLASQFSVAHSSSLSSHNHNHNHNHSHQQQHHQHLSSPNPETRSGLPSEKFDLSSLDIQNASSPDVQGSVLVFKNSRPGNIGSGGNNGGGNNNNDGGGGNSKPVISSTVSSWIESASKMTNGKQQRRRTSNKPDEEEEEDEGEDLFQGTSDSFFSAKPVKPTEVLKDVDMDSPMPPLSSLSPTPRRSFMLVKPKPQQPQQLQQQQSTKRNIFPKGEGGGADNNCGVSGGAGNTNPTTDAALSSPSSQPPQTPPSSSTSSSSLQSPLQQQQPSSSTSRASNSDKNNSTALVNVASSPSRTVSAAVPIPSPSNGSHTLSF